MNTASADAKYHMKTNSSMYNTYMLYLFDFLCGYLFLRGCDANILHTDERTDIVVHRNSFADKNLSYVLTGYFHLKLFNMRLLYVYHGAIRNDCQMFIFITFYLLKITFLKI